MVAGNPGKSRPLRSSWTISGAKVQQKNDISKFLPSEMEEKCKKGENDYRKPVKFSLWSELRSPLFLPFEMPSQGISPWIAYVPSGTAVPPAHAFADPNRKRMFQLGTYYIPTGRLSIIRGKKGAGCQKRSRLFEPA